MFGSLQPASWALFFAPFVLTPCLLAQGGNDCSTAVPISGEVTIQVDTRQNTTSNFGAGGACGNPVIPKDQFFRLLSRICGSSAAREGDPFGSGFIGVLGLYQGSGCSAVCVTRAYTTTQLGVTAHWTVQQPGETYLIQFGGQGPGGIGALSPLRIRLLPGDVCDFPTPVAGFGSFPVSVVNGSISSFAGSNPCAGSVSMGYDRFYTWTAPISGDIQFASYVAQVLSHWRRHLAVYAGDDCNAACVAYTSVTTPTAPETSFRWLG